MTRDQYLRQAASLRPLFARSGVIGDAAAHTDDVWTRNQGRPTVFWL